MMRGCRYFSHVEDLREKEQTLYGSFAKQCPSLALGRAHETAYDVKAKI